MPELSPEIQIATLVVAGLTLVVTLISSLIVNKGQRDLASTVRRFDLQDRDLADLRRRLPIVGELTSILVTQAPNYLKIGRVCLGDPYDLEDLLEIHQTISKTESKIVKMMVHPEYVSALNYLQPSDVSDITNENRALNELIFEWQRLYKDLSTEAARTLASQAAADVARAYAEFATTISLLFARADLSLSLAVD